MIGVSRETGSAHSNLYLYDPNYGLNKFTLFQDLTMKVKAMLESPDLALNYRAASALSDSSYLLIYQDSNIDNFMIYNGALFIGLNAHKKFYSLLSTQNYLMCDISTLFKNGY